MTHDLHVLHVINSLDRGGAETNLVRLCEATATRGVSNVVLTLRDGGALRRDAERFSRVLPLTALPEVLRLLRTPADAPQLLVGWMYWGCVAASLLAHARPVVWSLRHVPDQLQRESRATRVALALLRRFSNVGGRRKPALLITNSAAAEDAHRRLGLEAPCRVIEKGVDTAHFRTDPQRGERLRRELRIDPNDVLLLQVGRAHPHKGQHVLLDAAIPLLTQHASLRLLLVGRGTGSVRHPIFEMAQLAPRVHCMDDQADLVPAYSASDILINPSATESFPTVVIEAMSCGLPCVVTDTGASRDVVGDTGMWATPGSAESLRVAVESLLAVAPEMRHDLGDRARRRVIDRYSLTRMADGFVDAYRAVVAG